MPIFGGSPAECFETFRAHVAGLVAKTVTQTHPVLCMQFGSNARLGFREQQPVAVPIPTRFGRLYFYLGQSLKAVPDGGRFRLETHH